MTTTYLGHDLMLPAGRHATRIKAALSRSGRTDLEALRNDIARLDVYGLLELNELGAKANAGTVMLATIAGMPPVHALSYDHTIQLLKHVKTLEDSDSLTSEEIELAAVALIGGYRTKQGLNLLVSMTPIFEKGSKLSTLPGIDDAFVAHLEKTRVRKLNWADIMHICDALPQSSLMGTLKAVTKILLDNHQYEEIKALFSTYYDNNHLTTVHVNAFKEVLGEDQLLRMCQEKMMTSAGFYSIHRLQEVFGEQTLLSEGFTDKIRKGLSNAQDRVTAPEYWKHLNKFDELDLIEHWPLTAKLMIEHYDTTPLGYLPSPSRGIVEFATKHALHLTLLEKAIEGLRQTLVKLAQEPDRDFLGMSASDVLSHGSNHHNPKLKRLANYNLCLALCNEIGLIEAKSVIADIHPQVISDFAQKFGEFKNPFEIIKHYPQAKGLFLEDALGL